MPSVAAAILSTMKRFYIVSAILICVAAQLIAQGGLPSSKRPQHNRPSAASAVPDESAVLALVDHWREAWDNFDASVLANDYADDAEWQNAFGVRQKGRDNILAFVSQVLKRPQVHTRHTDWGLPRARFLRPDVAVATRDYVTTGQKSVAGDDMGERHTHAVWILTKESGTWLIASHVIYDDLQPNK